MSGQTPQEQGFTLRSDQVAGAAFVVFGVIVFLLSGDLPFGSMSAPGAGMMPKLLIALMIAFGIALMFGAAKSAPFVTLDWSDSGHALKVVVISAAAIASYQSLGFLITMSLLVFVLLIVVERKPVHYAAAYALLLTVLAYALFAKALKSPLEQGILGF